MSVAEKFEVVCDKVYEKGLKDFCNAFTNYGKRKGFQYAFQYTNFEGFTFPETIKPTGAGSVFYNYRGATLPKNIDFSQCVFASNVTSETKVPHKMFFESPDIKRIDDIKLPAQYRYPYTFCGCTGLEEIEIVRNYPETVWTNTFLHCSSLKKVRFSDRVEKSIDFRSCPLTLETLEYIILDVLNDNWEIDASTITLSSISYARLRNDTRTFPFYQAYEEMGNPIYLTLLEIISRKNWNLELGAN